jgi:hypothetical protein
MAFNVNTGQHTYSTDDLIGFAKIGSFGQKSAVLLQALVTLKQYELQYPILEKQLNDLRESVKVSGKIQEVVVENNPRKSNTNK